LCAKKGGGIDFRRENPRQGDEVLLFGDTGQVRGQREKNPLSRSRSSTKREDNNKIILINIEDDIRKEGLKGKTHTELCIS